MLLDVRRIYIIINKYLCIYKIIYVHISMQTTAGQHVTRQVSGAIM